MVVDGVVVLVVLDRVQEPGELLDGEVAALVVVGEVEERGDVLVGGLGRRQHGSDPRRELVARDLPSPFASIFWRTWYQSSPPAT